MTQAEEKALYDGYNGINESMRKRIFYEDYSVAKTFLWSMASCLDGGSDNPGEGTISSAISLYVDIYTRKHVPYMKPQQLKESINGKYYTMRQINEINFDNTVEMALEYIYSHEPEIRDKDKSVEFIDNMVQENSEVNSDVEKMHMDDPDWGLVPDKPVFVAGFDGIRWYMAHLLSPDGKSIQYNRLGSMAINGIAGPVDIYDIYVDQKKYMKICLCLYGKENSVKAPKGLIFSTNPNPGLSGQQDIGVKDDINTIDTGKKKSNKPLLIISIAAVLVIAVIIACVLIFTKGKGDKESNDTETVKENVTEENNKEESEDASGDSDVDLDVDVEYKSVKGYTLEEVGRFNKLDNMIINRGMWIITNGEGFQVLSKDGKVLNETYYGIDDKGDEYYTVRNSTDEVNSVGLITIDGEELIPCEAASIKWMNNKTGRNTGRYMRVIYSTGETDNEDEAFFYMTDDPISIYPDDDDKMYTGYARIYDTKERRFVGDIKYTTPDRNGANECGDGFTLEDESGAVSLYDSEGNVIMKTEKRSEVGNGYIIVYEDGKYNVYDQKGKLTYQTEEQLSQFNSDNGYIKVYVGNGNGYYVIDVNGNKVLPDNYGMVTSEKNNIFSVQTNSEKYQLVNINGKVLAESANTISECTLDGYYYYNELDSYTLVGVDGVIRDDINNSPYELTVANDGKGLVINDKEYSLDLGKDNLDALVPGLVSIKSESQGKYGVFDMFTGNQLLDYDYDYIVAVGGYIYVVKDGEYTVYKPAANYE